MRRERLATLFFCLSILFGVKAQEFKFTPSYEVVVKSLGQKDILKQCSRDTPKDVEGIWLVDSLSVQKLHANFGKVQKLKPVCCPVMNWRIEDLQRYAFQYLGVSIKGKKFIYVNAFPKAYLEDVKEISKEKLLDFCDGGTDFWGVLFDMQTETFSSLSVNGGG